LKENILNGKEDANEEEVIASSKAANVHVFISNSPAGCTFLCSMRLVWFLVSRGTEKGGKEVVLVFVAAGRDKEVFHTLKRCGQENQIEGRCDMECFEIMLKILPTAGLQFHSSLLRL
ncbi:hypothetical protein KI387_019379, partial [Taxus chinensis]